MKQFIRIHLKRAIMLVLSPAAGMRSSQQSDESFGRQLDAFIRGGAFNLCQLLLRCLGDDVEALLRIVYSQVVSCGAVVRPPLFVHLFGSVHLCQAAGSAV